MHLSIAIALIWRETESGREVLVARRRDDADHLPGMWEFPGGKCEDGENPRDCAIREAREELGVEIEITAGRVIIEYVYPTRRVTIHPFDAVILSGEPCAIECAEVFWSVPHALSADRFPAANAELIAALQNEAR